MTRKTALLSLLLPLLLAVGGAAAQPAEMPVYRLDSVIANAVKGGIKIQARGAVQSGGWKQLRLKVTKTNADSIVVEFVGQPPPPEAVVIQGLLPVFAQVTVKAGERVASVRAVAAANEITAQVLR